MKKVTLSLFVALACVATALCAAPCHADVLYPTFPTWQIQHRSHYVSPGKIRLVRHREIKGSRMLVRFSDGSKWSMGPCQYEDSERCYWNAQQRGNGQGHSFVRMFRHTFYLDGWHR